MGLNSTELAARLGLSKARISQYVAEGKLAGCYTGEGRARRFDLAAVAEALGQRLDLGQMLGNGAETRRKLRTIASSVSGDAQPVPAPAAAQVAPREGAPLSAQDPDRLALANIQIKEEEARRKRRDNERDEGRWVLAEEVERQTAQALAAELGKFEQVLRDAARRVADVMGVDARQVRKLLLDEYREHRHRRSREISGEAAEAQMTEAEIAAEP